MKRPKYKEMYEWEKASLYATEMELQKLQKMHAELFDKYIEKCKECEGNQYFGISTSSQVLFNKDKSESYKGGK